MGHGKGCISYYNMEFIYKNKNSNLQNNLSEDTQIEEFVYKL